MKIATAPLINQEDLKSVIEVSPRILIALNSKLDVEFSNQAFRDLFGYKLKSNFLDYLVKEEEADFEFYIAGLLEERIKSDQDFNFYCKPLAGNKIITSICGSKVQTEESDFVLLSLKDVTEESELAERLYKLEKDLELVIQSTNDGYWDWYVQEDYEYMSPRFWEMFGYDFRTKKHHPSEWQKIIFEEDLALAKTSIENHISSKGEIPFLVELRYHHADGSTVWVICRGEVVEWSEKGEPLRIIGSHTDITRLKEFQVALEMSSKMATVGQMAGEIAHEINNPLTVLNLNIERCLMALEHSDYSKVRILFEESKGTVKRIGETVNSLKKISHNAEPNFEEVIIGSVIKDAINICKHMSKKKGIEINLDENNLDTKINCSQVEISQVVMNLISNSIFAVEGLDEKWIQISVKKDERNMSIEIVDSGKGIDKSVQEQMMQPFFTTKPVGEGSGLGLGICQAILQRHRGKLLYLEDRDHTTFQLILPCT